MVMCPLSHLLTKVNALAWCHYAVSWSTRSGGTSSHVRGHSGTPWRGHVESS